MNIFIAFIFWMIGLKLQMDTAYYVAIVLGVIVQFLVKGAKNA